MTNLSKHKRWIRQIRLTNLHIFGALFLISLRFYFLFIKTMFRFWFVFIRFCICYSQLFLPDFRLFCWVPVPGDTTNWSSLECEVEWSKVWSRVLMKDSECGCGVVVEFNLTMDTKLHTPIVRPQFFSLFSNTNNLNSSSWGWDHGPHTIDFLFSAGYFP